jgi:phosphate transport system substrate-binding protein
MVSASLTGLTWLGVLLASVPLFSVLYMLVVRGGARISWETLSALPPAGFEMGGRFGNAIVGTLVMVGIAGLISVPFGILAAVDQSWRENPGVGKLIDWPGSAMSSTGNSGMAQRVRITEGAIGYLEYGFARRLGLPVALLENRAGNYVAPSSPSGRSGLVVPPQEIPEDLCIFVTDPAGGDAYPIVSYSWLLLYQRDDEFRKAAGLKQAVAWGLGEAGQDIAEEMGYIPLPAPVVERALASLERVN